MNAISKITTSNEVITADVAVDRLGVLLAQIASLNEIAEEYKSWLKSQGEGAYAGVTFDATVSTFDQDTLPIADVRAYLARTPAGKRWMKDHTVTKEVTKVLVKARVQRAA